MSDSGFHYEIIKCIIYFYCMFRFAEKNEIQQQNKINLYEFRVTGAP